MEVLAQMMVDHPCDPLQQWLADPSNPTLSALSPQVPADRDGIPHPPGAAQALGQECWRCGRPLGGSPSAPADEDGTGAPCSRPYNTLPWSEGDVPAYQ